MVRTPVDTPGFDNEGAFQAHLENRNTFYLGMSLKRRNGKEKQKNCHLTFVTISPDILRGGKKSSLIQVCPILCVWKPS